MRQLSEPTQLKPFSRAQEEVDGLPDFWLIVLVAGHLGLGLLFRRVPSLATYYVIGLVLLGLKWALWGEQKEVKKVIYLSAYLTGAEILWRMNGADVYWEAGKYALVLLLGLLLFRFLTRWSGLLLLYLLLMIPGIIIALERLGFSAEARDTLSFNLSGPLALGVSGLALAQLSLNRREVCNLLWSGIAPIISIAALAAYGTATTEELVFNGEANYLTSGGFGPNQVSTILGLGAFLSILLIAYETKPLLRYLTVVILVGMLTQTLLTFSRGGLLGGLLGTIVFGLHAIKDARLRRNVVMGLLVIGAAGYYIIPWVDELSEGWLSVRWGEVITEDKQGEIEVQTTGRKDLAEIDWEIWDENPIFGVGAGISIYEHKARMGEPFAAHTEFTRLIAEHGSVGIMMMGVLVLVIWQRYWAARSALARGWVAGLGGWAMLTMFHSAMRIAATSFILGVALIQWVDEEDEDDREEGLPFAA
jgi:hypothetical protein